MDTVSVILYVGGNVVMGHGTVEYSTSAATMMRIARSMSLSELTERLHQKLKIDSTKFSLKMSTKYVYMELSRMMEVHLNIEDDECLQFMLDHPDLRCLHLYIKSEPIAHNMELDEPETCTPSINQGFHKIGLGKDVGTSTVSRSADAHRDYSYREHGTGDWDQYIVGSLDKDIIQWPSNARGWDSNIGTSAYLDQNVTHHEVSWDVDAHRLGHVPTAPSAQDQTRRDLVGDSYHDAARSDSEPNTSLSELEENCSADDDEIGADVSDYLHAYPGKGTSSPTQCHTMMPSHIAIAAPSTYEYPPFFSLVTEEQIPDSIGVPSRSRSSYYNHDKGELCVNMMFKDKKDLIACVKDYSVRVVKCEYHVVQSSRTIWKVRCKNRSSSVNCRWGLRASLKSRLGYWKITKYGGSHTCISSQVSLDHHNLDMNMVASTLLGIVRNDPSYEIKDVKLLIKDRYNYDISYQKAWFSLKRAVENVYGTWKSSVCLLPKFLGALVKYNPGTIVEWNHLPTNNPTVKLLNYVFWAFRPCIDGFTHCRKIICVDGIHLYSKYKHKLLIAVCLDANNQILPLAFAVVNAENYDSWKWFLENLSKHVVRGVSGVCLISDKHRTIISAVEDICDFRHPRGEHRFCLRHICSNFNTQFNNVHLKDLCWHAGTQHQIRKFDATMDAIKDKHPLAHKYLSGIPREKWTLAHDGGWRCEVVTTNMSECLDGVLKGVRRLPICAIVQLTFQRCVQYFVERVSKNQCMAQNNHLWPDYAYHKYEQWFARSSNHTITRFDAGEKSASVMTGRGQHIQVVQLTTRECSCGKWTIFGIPCSHAICAAKWYGLDPTTLVQPWFSMHEYIDTYEGRFQPIADEHYWDAPTFELHHNLAQCERQRSRRGRTTRIRDETDRPTVRERQRSSCDNSS